MAYFRGPTLPPGFASGNGRLEATEYDIATKRPTRIIKVLVKEGDLVAATYLDVLDQEGQLFRAERDLASTTRDQLTAVVQVYKALAGGWQTSRAIDKVEGE